MSSPRWSELPIDQSRGSQAMALFIVTEALLFVVMLFAYFYVGHGRRDWPPELPKLRWPLTMLAVLATSSAVLCVGERAARREAAGRAKAALIGVLLLGIAFLAIQSIEYTEKLGKLRPTTSAYGSFFYTITSVHGLHLLIGIAMLCYVLILPWVGRSDEAPHRPLHNAAMYWHFVDVVWLVLVALLYVLPHVRA